MVIVTFRQRAMKGFEAPKFSKEEELALHEKHKAGDKEATNLLIQSILPWAWNIARRYQNRGISSEDLDDLALDGAMAAVDHLDPTRGRLTTCTFWRVRQKISSHMRSRSEDGRPRSWVRRGIFVHDISDHEVEDRSVPQKPPLEEREQKDLVSLTISRALKRVPDKEKFILIARILLGYTLKDVGDILGVTRERVRQIEVRARKRFRGALEFVRNDERPQTNHCESLAVLIREAQLKMEGDIPLKRPVGAKNAYGTVKERIVKFLKDHGPSTPKEISKGTNLEAGSIRASLYKNSGKTYYRTKEFAHWDVTETQTEK